MLTQYEMFFERQTPEVRKRGMWLLAVIEGLLEDGNEKPLTVVSGMPVGSMARVGSRRWNRARRAGKVEQLATDELKTSMAKHRGCVTQVARELGRSRMTVYNWLRSEAANLDGPPPGWEVVSGLTYKGVVGERKE